MLRRRKQTNEPSYVREVHPKAAQVYTTLIDATDKDAFIKWEKGHLDGATAWFRGVRVRVGYYTLALDGVTVIGSDEDQRELERAIREHLNREHNRRINLVLGVVSR